MASQRLEYGASGAWAQSQAPQSRNNSEYTDTLYATDQHMGFSIRTTLVQWLGGVVVAREKGAKAAEQGGRGGGARAAPSGPGRW